MVSEGTEPVKVATDDTLRVTWVALSPSIRQAWGAGPPSPRGATLPPVMRAHHHPPSCSPIKAQSSLPTPDKLLLTLQTIDHGVRIAYYA